MIKDLNETLTDYIRSSHALIYTVTFEDDMARAAALKYAEEQGESVLFWDGYAGLRPAVLDHPTDKFPYKKTITQATLDYLIEMREAFPDDLEMVIPEPRLPDMPSGGDSEKLKQYKAQCELIKKAAAFNFSMAVPDLETLARFMMCLSSRRFGAKDRAGSRELPGIPNLHIVAFDAHFDFEDKETVDSRFVAMFKQLSIVNQASQRSLVLCGARQCIPEELKKEFVMIDVPLPETKRLRAVASKFMEGNNIPHATKDLDRLSEAGRGLTGSQFLNALSLSIVKRAEVVSDGQGGTRRKFNFQASDIRDERDKVIGMQRSLTVLHERVTPEDYSGHQVFVNAIQEDASAFSEEGRKFGAKPPRGILLLGPPGCLSGDTLVNYHRGKRNSSRPITLANLYRRFHGLSVSGKGGNRDWDLSIPTFLHSHDTETGVVFYNQILSVLDSGEKEVVLLTTQGGRQLKLTADHPVLTNDSGYVKASELEVGQSLVVKGSMTTNPAAERHGRQERVVVEGLKFYSAGWRKFVDDKKTCNRYEYKRQHRARLVVEAAMNGLSYDAYIHRLKTDPDAVRLRTLSSELVVHHMDENPMNDVLSNLDILPKKDHDRLHTDETNFNVEYTQLDYVESVESYGVEHTYDIQMQSPGNNFAISNGLIVHNTGKTYSGALLATLLDASYLRHDLSATKGKYVGETGANFRNDIKILSAVGRTVSLNDEVEKVFGSSEESSFGNGTGDILDEYLYQLQYGLPDVVVIMTTNRPYLLPPELLRRMSSCYYLGFPDDAARFKLFEIQFRKLNEPVNRFDVAELVERTKMWTGDEIRKLVEKARRIALAANPKRPMMNNDHLFAALPFVSPVFRNDNKSITKTLTWAVKNGVLTGDGKPLDRLNDEFTEFNQEHLQGAQRAI